MPPYSLLPTPYSLLPTPYSLLPTPYSLSYDKYHDQPTISTTTVPGRNS
ncbi:MULTISPECIES: hypothetical protein [unclassified Moorena]|nr:MULTISPECIES: hypothetical protein [unclassified Moorena]NEO21592.1 hypothetical protein [Moorena sp. SIO4A5]NEQ61845.1 hypothetical protein [Moorena sp. SIO4A1]